MSRTITVSTDVYAEIWARREPGEESEDSILRRVLGCGAGQAHEESSLSSSDDGFHDSRNGVHFREGFEAHRIYKRHEYKAVASNGAWLRPDTGERFLSLNQLNRSFAVGPEDVWRVWKFRAPDGSIQPLDKLRH